jgi:hypothetical protein
MPNLHKNFYWNDLYLYNTKLYALGSMFSSRADIHKQCPTFEQDASCIRAGLYLNIDGVRTMVVSSGISRSECQGNVQGTNTFASCVKENEVSPRQDHVT